VARGHGFRFVRLTGCVGEMQDRFRVIHGSDVPIDQLAHGRRDLVIVHQ
jgi:hypothetical protein